MLAACVMTHDDVSLRTPRMGECLVWRITDSTPFPPAWSPPFAARLLPRLALWCFRDVPVVFSLGISLRFSWGLFGQRSLSGLAPPGCCWLPPAVRGRVVSIRSISRNGKGSTPWTSHSGIVVWGPLDETRAGRRFAGGRNCSNRV